MNECTISDIQCHFRSLTVTLKHVDDVVVIVVYPSLDFTFTINTLILAGCECVRVRAIVHWDEIDHRISIEME